MVRNLHTGRVAKLGLLQVQLLKKELFRAMAALDAVEGANKLNVQLLALLPAAGLGLLGSRALVRLAFALRTRRALQSAASRLRDGAALGQSLEALVLADMAQPPPPPPGRRARASCAPPGILSDAALGEACVLLHRHAEVLKEVTGVPATGQLRGSGGAGGRGTAGAGGGHPGRRGRRPLSTVRGGLRSSRAGDEARALDANLKAAIAAPLLLLAPSTPRESGEEG